MTKLLEKAIAKARELPAEDQDAVAVAMLSMAEETPVVALDEETRSAGSPTAIQRDQPLVGKLPAAGHVLLHRRLRDPVSEGRPGSQHQRREELRHQKHPPGS